MKVSMHNKQRRREGAKRRFRIRTFEDWSANGGRYDTVEYDAYVARKQIEAKALGVTL